MVKANKMFRKNVFQQSEERSLLFEIQKLMKISKAQRYTGTYKD